MAVSIFLGSLKLEPLLGLTSTVVSNGKGFLEVYSFENSNANHLKWFQQACGLLKYLVQGN
jgi:hypothetical protein